MGIIIILLVTVYLLNLKYRIEPLELLDSELNGFIVITLTQPNPEGFYEVPKNSIKIAGNTPYGYVFRRHVYRSEFLFEPVQVSYKIINNNYYVRPSVITTADLEMMLFPNDTLFTDHKEFHFFACPWYEKAVKHKLSRLNALKHHNKIH